MSDIPLKRGLLTVAAAGALAVVFRRQLVRLLTLTTGTWVGTSE